MSDLLGVAADLHGAPPPRLILRAIKKQPTTPSVMPSALPYGRDVNGCRQLKR
jgi:hypothetical protein